MINFKLNYNLFNCYNGGSFGGRGDGSHGYKPSKAHQPEKPPEPPPIPSNIENSNLVLPDKEILITRKDKYYRIFRNGKYYKCYGLKNRLNSTLVFNTNILNKNIYNIILNKDLQFTMAKDRSYIRIAPAKLNTQVTFKISATGNYTLRLNDTLTDNQDKKNLQTQEIELTAGADYTFKPYSDANNINSLVFTITDSCKAKGGIK